MFSKILKDLRLEKKLIQKELGCKLGISLSSISMYERGERQPDLETLIKISKFFNVTTDYLLGLTDIPNYEKMPNQHQITNLTKNENELLEIFRRMDSERDQIKLIGRVEEVVAQMMKDENMGNFKSDSVQSTPSKQNVG